MKSTKLIAVLFVLLMVLQMSSCSDKNTDIDNEQNLEDPEVNESKPGTNELFIVGEANFAPISFEIDGEAAGISTEIVREIFDRMGYKVRIELAPWERCQQMVEAGTADGFFTPYYSDQRALKFLFTKENIIEEKNVIAVKKDSDIDFTGDVSEIERYKVANIIGYLTVDELKEQLEDLETIDIGNTGEALLILANRQSAIDMVINNEYILKYEINRLGLSDSIKLLEPSVANYKAYFAFTRKKDYSKLSDLFDKELIKLKNEEKYSEILNKYLGIH